MVRPCAIRAHVADGYRYAYRHISLARYTSGGGTAEAGAAVSSARRMNSPVCAAAERGFKLRTTCTGRPSPAGCPPRRAGLSASPKNTGGTARSSPEDSMGQLWGKSTTLPVPPTTGNGSGERLTIDVRDSAVDSKQPPAFPQSIPAERAPNSIGWMSSRRHRSNRRV